MMRNPTSEMKKLYHWLGDDFTLEVDAAMAAYLKARPKNTFGKHAYSLADFNLDVDTLKPYFADYLARYPVELEKIR